MDAGVQAVERFGTFLFPRSVHLSGFIEETGRCTERGKNVFISTACTHGSVTRMRDGFTVAGALFNDKLGGDMPKAEA